MQIEIGNNSLKEIVFDPFSIELENDTTEINNYHIKIRQSIILNH